MMKRLVILTIALLTSNVLFSQNYFGIQYAPYWTTNNSFVTHDASENQQDKYTLGYSVGFQGLTMSDRKISFSYGLQYSYQFLNNSNYYGYSELDDPLSSFKSKGREEKLYVLELPATWRYNFMKGSKLQPYVSVATTIVIPIKQQATITNVDGSTQDGEINYTPFVLPDFGIGLNYKTEKWMFNIQPTIRPISIWKKVGVGFSVMRKF